MNLSFTFEFIEIPKACGISKFAESFVKSFSEL